MGTGATCLNRLDAAFDNKADGDSTFAHALGAEIADKCSKGPASESVDDASTDITQEK